MKTKNYSLHLKEEDTIGELNFFINLEVPESISKEDILQALEKAEILMRDVTEYSSATKFTKEEFEIMDECFDGENERTLLKYLKRRYGWKYSFINYETDIQYCMD